PTHADAAARTRYILDDHGLAERHPHMLGEDARERIGGPARRVRHDNRDWPRRIGLRPCDTRQSRQRGSARRKMKKSTARQVHGVYPSGRRTVNTEPLPCSLVTVTSPPIMRASLRVMASPSPVPPNTC